MEIIESSIWINKRFRGLFAAVISVSFLEILAIFDIHLPEFIAVPLFLMFIIGIGHETLKKGLFALAKINFSSINLLMLIAVLGAFALKEYEEAAVVIVLYTFGEYLEGYGIQTSRSSFRKLVESTPKVAFLTDGSEIPINQVKVGNILSIKPYAYIPLDGEIIKGSSSIDESAITGEPIPKNKDINDLVFAGTFNQQGYLEIKVTKLSKDSTLAKIIDLTFKANQTKANTQAFIEKFSQYYTPAVMLLALALTIIPVVFLGEPFKKWFVESLTLLVISCPCALVISTPVALFAAIGNASKKGAVIKGGKHLETIGRIQVIAMDKTRTLTFGKPIVTDVITFNDKTVDDVLACAAGIEIHSEHPVAKSIVDEAKNMHLTLHGSENFESVAGKGAKANCVVCYDKQQLIGNLDFITENLDVQEEVIKSVDSIHKLGRTAIIISDNQQVKGIIAVEDKIKPESAEAIRELKSMGIATIMLSGDNKIPALEVGKKLGIEDIRAELLPEEKAKVIEDLVKDGTITAMVGDGINDAPAIAWSSVGISMGAAGNDTAIEVSSIAILNDHIGLLPYLVKLGRKTMNIIHFNVWMAIFTKIVFIILAFSGYSNLVLAIFADVGVTILVILNSLRLIKFKA